MAKREQTFKRAARKRKAEQRAKRVVREQKSAEATTAPKPAKAAGGKKTADN